MKRLFFGTSGSILLALAVSSAEPARRIGTWELDQRAVFAVAAAPAGKQLHFVYADGTKLHHTQSPDGGGTWSTPEFVGNGNAPELAVDRQGTVHLVYEADGNRRVEYRSQMTGNAWTPALDLTHGLPGRESRAMVPRVAVDGADHVHVIYWTLWHGADWKPGSRTVYWRKPSGASAFESPILWGHQRDGGNARYGTLAVDPAGDLHVFYATNNNMSHAIERRIRFRDGTWGQHDLWRGQLVADWCIGAAVTDDGVAHLTVQSKLNEGLHVFYANTRTDPLVRTLQHDFGPENYETVTQLLATPNGDLWFAAGHIEHRENLPDKSPDVQPNVATWARFTADTGKWTERRRVSSPDAINLDARRGNHPRLILIEGQVFIFFAEQRPGEKWRHWLRRIDR